MSLMYHPPALIDGIDIIKKNSQLVQFKPSCPEAYTSSKREKFPSPGFE